MIRSNVCKTKSASDIHTFVAVKTYVKGKYGPSTTTQSISDLLLATCFGFNEKPSSGN
jgi:hypothetical protein